MKEDWSCHETPFAVHLDVVEQHGRQDQSRDSHQLPAHHHADEREPPGILDAIADDLAVQEVLELVQAEQKHKRRERRLRHEW